MPTSPELQAWQERILTSFYFLGSGLGAVVLVVSGGMLIKDKLWFLAVVDLVIFTWGVVGFLGRKRISYRVRAWGALAALYLLGTLLLLKVGPISGGPIWLFTFSVAAGFLVGLRATVATVILNAVTLAVVGLLIQAGLPPWLGAWNVALERWWVLSVNIVLLNALIASGTAGVFRSITTALSKEGQAARQLEQANQLLREEGRLRQEAETTLRESEERYRLAFYTSPDAININRLADGLYVEVNQGFTAMTGFTPEDVKGRTSGEIDIWADPRDRQTLVNGLLEKGYYENLEAKFRKKDGSLITALMSARVMKLAGVDHIISITRDISQRIAADQEKAKLETQLRQAQKMEAVGTLAGGIAHDFNNILGAIMGFSELAIDDARNGQVNPRDLEQIMASALRAKELVRQISAFSRKQEPCFKPLDLNQAVRGTLAILERTLPKMIGIETHLDQGLPPIQADPTQMEQVLLNLSSNAQHAMPQGGRLTIETQRVVLDKEYCAGHLEVQAGDYVLLSVSDTGKGMDKETVEHIFDPFFTTKEVGQGTGLGLSSAFGIIKSHGGHIHCYSEAGAGTTFKIYLPVPKEDLPEDHEGDDPEAGDLPAGNESILLVDDEENLRLLGYRALTGAGYAVRTAKGGEEALEIYRSQGGRPDLVVMDLGMPGMGGHKALAAMLEINPQAKVLIASGYSANAQVAAALQSGAAGYVAKPFNRAELLTKVRATLDKE